MIVPESLETVAAAMLSREHVRPVYDTYGFARIPATIESWLTGGSDSTPLPAAALPARPQTVVLVLLDAFGWQFFSRFVDQAPFLRRFLTDGQIYQLTSAFPSTTAVHVTLLHSGLAADQSGIYEWYIYEPDLQAVIGSLLFSPVFEHQADRLLEYGVDPNQVYPPERFYQRLSRLAVSSVVLLPATLAHSVYTRVMCAGALTVPFQNIADAAARLQCLFERQRGPTFYHLYIESIDAAMHVHGPDAPEVTNEISAVLHQLEQQILPVLRAAPGPVALAVTADHGQIAVDPQRAIVLNQLWPELEHVLRRGGDGQPLPPSGSRRVAVLHLKPETVGEAQARLQARLGERAQVVMTADLVQAGYFGPQPGDRLQARLGELVILPAAGEMITWHHPRARSITMRGMHGGLTADEMLTELAVLLL